MFRRIDIFVLSYWHMSFTKLTHVLSNDKFVVKVARSIQLTHAT